MAWFDQDTRIIITTLSESPGTMTFELYKDDAGKWWAGLTGLGIPPEYEIKYSGRSPEMACSELADHLRHS